MENKDIIISKLDILKKEIDFIKEHLADIILSQDDINSFEEAEKDLEKGRTKRL